MTLNYFFILFLTIFVFLTPSAISSPINVCNYTYFYEGGSDLTNYYLQSVNYVALFSDGSYSKTKITQVLVLSASNDANPSPSMVILDFYTRRTYCTVTKAALSFIILPNNTIVFLTDSKTQLYMVGKTCNNNQIGKNFVNSIVAYVWANTLGRFFVIESGSKNIYDHYENKETFRQADIDMLNSYNQSSFSNMTFDSSHEDLYLVLGTDILVYNTRTKQFWYKFKAHNLTIWDIRVISSPIPDKFCILSMQYDSSSKSFKIFRWQPDRSQFYANLSSIYVDISSNYMTSTLNQGYPPASISLIYRNEFLVMSFYNTTISHVILILGTDFSYQNYFYYPNNDPVNPASVHVSGGGVENTDIFFVHYCNIKTTYVTQYSLFSDVQSCARCQKGLNLWFYSYMRGCSNTCDDYTIKNFPFCEPKYNSQTCVLPNTALQLCQQCDGNYYNQISRFNISLECSPYFTCLSTTSKQYKDSNGNCQSCDGSCLTCVGGNANQCLSCTPNNFYDPFATGTICSNPCRPPTIRFGPFCLSDRNSCPYGFYSAPTDINICQQTCNSSCESCYANPNNCTSCAGDLILFNNTCVAQCPQRYYYGADMSSSLSNKYCLSCNVATNVRNLSCNIYNCQLPNCSVCNYNNNTCQQCLSGSFLSSSGVCQNSCPSNYVLISSSCVPCDASCGACSVTINNCTSCQNSLLFLDTNFGTCVETCHPGSFGNTTTMKCQSCSSNCSQCNKLPDNCTGCASGIDMMTLNITTGNTYYCTDCRQDSYYNSGLYCLPCMANCRKCPSSTTCSNCNTNYQLDKNGKCYYCNISCSYCQPTDYNKCESCSNTALFADLFTGYCLSSCRNGTYVLNTNPNQCNKCSNLCHTCLNTFQNCTTCSDPTNALLYNATTKTSSCVTSCPTTYYNNTLITPFSCFSCPKNCDICSDIIHCQNCTSGYVLQNDGTCNNNCPTNTYLNSSSGCSPCSSTCDQCANSADHCLSCSNSLYWYNFLCYASCPIGSYQDGIQCSQCDATCFSCSNYYTNCTLCPIGFVLYGASCVPACPQGFYAYNSKCYKCVDGCSACYDAYSCNFCNSSLYLKGGGCVSDCGDGFTTSWFSVNSTYAQQCVACSSGCRICGGNKKCTECENLANFIDESGFCVGNCSQVNYFSQQQSFTRGPLNGYLKYCLNCSSSCLSCNQTAGNCTSCQPGQYLMKTIYSDQSFTYACSNSCDTNSGYYISQDIYCLSCPANCQSCPNNVCTHCTSGYFLDPNNQCVIGCPQYYSPDSNKICQTCSGGYFVYPFSNGSYQCVRNCTAPGVYLSQDLILSLNFCYNCTANCMKCLNGESCSNCSVGYTKNLITMKCDSICQAGTFLNNGECSPCDTSAFCDTCSGSAQQCTSCTSHHFLVTDLTGVSNCLPCNQNCLECNQSSVNCTSCPANWTLYKNSCVQKVCPANCSDCHLENTNNCTSCKLTYSLINDSCITKTCPENCSECSDSNFSICTQCQNGFKLYKNQCISQCPAKTYESNNHSTCYPCTDTQCVVCKSENLCVQCNANYFLNSNQCVSSCNDNQYLNDTSQECLNCSQDCYSCFGPESTNCLSCNPFFTLKGTTCKSSCDSQNACPQPIPDNYTITLLKSDYVSNDFYIIFNHDVSIPDYVNVTGLVNISIDGINSSEFTYTAQKVANDKFLVTVTTLQSVKSPNVRVNLTQSAQQYIRGTYNASVINSNNSEATITLETIVVSSESKETKEIKQQITYSTFVTLSYILLCFCAVTYIFDTKRLSFYWKFTDFMQVTALIIFFKLNYDERFVAYLELLFNYHADFLAFMGKNIDTTTGQVSYFGSVLKKSVVSDDLGATFTKFLGTKIFIANGFNAIFFIYGLNIFTFLMKYYLRIHKSIFNSEDGHGVYGILQYFHEYVLFSALIRAVQFFFYLICTSVLIQFYSLDFTNDYNKMGMAVAVSALFYYLIFFSWLSKNVINNPDVYESEEERWKYDAVFHGIETKTFIQRNHFNFVHIKKFGIIIGIVTILQDMNLLLGYLLFVQIVASARYLKWRPFSSLKLNLLNFLTEIAFLVIVCILLKVSEITKTQQDGNSTVISDESMNSIIQAADAIISFNFIVLVFYCIVAGMLLFYYVIKNIDCICFVFFHQKMPEEDATIIESFEANKREKELENNGDESNKYRIPKKKEMREVAEQEEQWQKDLEAYKKEHIVKVG